MILNFLAVILIAFTFSDAYAADVCDDADLSTDILCYCRKTTPYSMNKEQCGMCQHIWQSDENICSTGRIYSNSQSIAPSTSSVATSACKDKTDTAVNICEQQKGSMMGQAKNMLGGISQMMGSNIQAACSEWGRGMASINAGLSAFSAGCSREYLSCRSACDADLSEAKAAMAAAPVTSPQYEAARAKIASIETDQKRCGRLQEHLASAASGVDQLIAASQTAEQCKAMTGDTIAEMCAKDPSLPICGSQGPADCSDPSQASTNTICICQVNPRDARCGLSGKTQGYNATNMGSSGAADSLSAGSFGSGSAGSGDGYSDMTFGKPGAASDRNLLQGGSGGGKGGVGGGGQNGGPDGGGGRAGSGQSAKILNGYYGGKGGAAGGAGAGSRGAYGAQAGYRPGSGAGGNANVDLRQFMPGGKMDPQRGLAGVSGPDGITGPHTDIWKKVNKRYFAVTPSLLP